MNDADLPLPLASQGHAGIIFLVDAAGRILLQQRDDDQPPEGYGRWAFPGGGWEDGETPRECAHREMLEETALDLADLRHLGAFELGIGSHGFPVIWHVFASFEPVNEAAIEVNEGLAFTLFSPEDAAGLRMNPRERFVLDAFLASDLYRNRGLVGAPAAALVELDRWGHLLLARRAVHTHPGDWSAPWDLPGATLGPGESPDTTATREFEDATGILLESVSFYRSFASDDIPSQLASQRHIYFVDADLDVEMLTPREGEELRYLSPRDLPEANIAPASRPILEEFVVSPAYKRLFH